MNLFNLFRRQRAAAVDDEPFVPLFQMKIARGEDWEIYDGMATLPPPEFPTCEVRQRETEL